MLLDFSVENWKSFAGTADLSLMATLERHHRNNLARIDGFRSAKALPVAAIYGGNASGKTNLFDALSFLRWMVIGGAQLDEPIPVNQFRLQERHALTCFDITVLAEGTVYRLAIDLDAEVIWHESVEILQENKEAQLVYERESGAEEARSFSFGKNIESEGRWDLVAQSLRPNQLFLNAAANNQLHELLPLFRWFRDSLVLVGVDSHEADSFGLYVSHSGEREEFLDYVSRMLQSLDTGIEKIGGEDWPLNAVPMRERALKQLSVSGAERISIIVREAQRDYGFEMYLMSGTPDNPTVKRLRSYHRGSNGELVPFNLNEESSGSKRLLGLLPMLFDLSSIQGSEDTRVYVVDELDRCFHTMLTRRLIELFLQSCNPQTRKQIIFTTHDLLLMDQNLLRRDEMYLTERSGEGESQLIGLNEFRGLRADKDLVRSYLDGRFGGIPMLG